jgi:hypothetical protein
MRPWILRVGALLFGATVGHAADNASRPATVDLGGPRQARAEIVAADDNYTIKVRFLAVRSFDETTNTRLNRDKGRLLALQALARHLAGDRPAEFSVSGARVERAGLDGKLYCLTLRVPRAGVARVREGDESATGTHPGSEHLAFSSALFTRKTEYLTTLDQLTAAVRTDLATAAREANDEEDDFAELAAKIEARGLKNLGKVKSEIQGDLLLLAIEKDELLQAGMKREDDLRVIVQAAVLKHKRKLTEKR